MTRVLILGQSGKLGSSVSNVFASDTIVTADRNKYDLLHLNSLHQLLAETNPTHIVNCAGLARRQICQQNPELAINVNIIGTSNLCNAILNANATNQQTIRLLHISSDAVYKPNDSDFHEDDSVGPICHYGWSKLGSECAVRIVPNSLIIRTRFHTSSYSYPDAATDLYTSSISLDKLSLLLKKLTYSEVTGVINIADKCQSDYALRFSYNKSILPITFQDILKHSAYPQHNNYCLSVERLNRLLEEE